jgi:cell division protein FtsQ
MTKRRKKVQKKHVPVSDRQQKRTQQRGQLNRSTIIALLVIALLGLLVSQLPHLPKAYEKVSNGLVAWSGNNGFTIQNVNVTGRNRVAAPFIMQALQISRGMPIFSYDPKAAQNRLSENPWFKSVNVERRLPNTILIRLTERTPAARWQVNGKQAVIDAEGVVLTTENIDAYKNLPVLIGQEAQHKMADLVALLQGQPEIGKQVTVATWLGNRRWDLTLSNNMIIRLPANQPELALARLAVLDQKNKVLARDIVSVDLRLPDQAILQPTIRANALIERPDFNDTPDPSKKNI